VWLTGREGSRAGRARESRAGGCLIEVGSTVEGRHDGARDCDGSGFTESVAQALGRRGKREGECGERRGEVGAFP
jgi:hypothetical protein